MNTATTAIDREHLRKPYRPCQLSSSGDSCKACRELLEVELIISDRGTCTSRSPGSTSLVELLDRHQELRTEVNRIHNPTILQVPPEIASYIFELCMPPKAFDSSFDNYDLWREPADLLTLGAVCRGWRRIAWSTPLLWTVILMQLDYRDFSWLVQFITGCLRRSGGLPLSIHIGHSRLGDKVSLKDALPAIELVNTYSDRWRHLDLDVPSSFVSSFCGGSNGGQYLRSLRIRPIGFNERVTPKFKILNSTLPSPDTLYLMFVRFGFISVDWSNVTRIDLTVIDVNGCIQLFQLAQRLIVCYLSRVENWEMSLTNDIITHNTLKELRFSHPTIDMSIFFGRFSFPALEKLSLNLNSEHLPSEALISMIERSSCRLKELYIVNTNFDTFLSLAPLLSVTPDLEILDVPPPRISDIAWGDLFDIVTGSPSTFLPKLHTLKMHYGHVFFYSGERAITEALIQRMKWPASPLPTSHKSDRHPLRRVEITFSRYTTDIPLVVIPEASIPPLLALRQGGLDLRIGYSGEDFDLIQTSLEFHSKARDI